MIFYARRTSAHPNCYLFYCPNTEACPMKPAAGLVSYKITRDTRASEDKPIKSENFSSDEYSLSSDAGTFTSLSQSSRQNLTATLQQSVFHQASELLNHIGKHLDNMEFHTVLPESQGAEQSESLDSLPRQKEIILPPTSPAAEVGSTTQSSAPGTSSATVTPLPTSPARMESLTTSLHPAKPTTVSTSTATSVLPRATPGVPGTTVALTQVPLSSPTTSASPSPAKRVATDSTSATAPSGPRTPAVPPEPTVVPPSDTSHVTLPSFPGFTLSASASPTSSPKDLEGSDPSDSESFLPEGFLRGKALVQLGEKSSLIAALLFGVIFLLLVIALTGKKIHESLQRRRYTRLDYLINGMYADV